MSNDLLGQICSLLAAVNWAAALILFKQSGESISPLPLNLFKNVVGIALLAITLLLFTEPGGTPADYPIEDIYILLISGFLGIALADTLLFACLNLVGVGMYVVIDCAYSPMVVLVSWFMLGEEIGMKHYVGGSLILFALIFSSGHQLPVARTRGQLLLGIFLGLLSIALMAVGIVMAKPVLEVGGFPLFWATTIRLFAGTFALAAMMAASPARGRLWSVFVPSKTWKLTVPASIFGAYLSMVLWVAGFKYTNASTAAILNQTSVIFALILAAIFLKEELTGRKLLSITLALSGAAIITLGLPTLRFDS